MPIALDARRAAGGLAAKAAGTATAPAGAAVLATVTPARGRYLVSACYVLAGAAAAVGDIANVALNANGAEVVRLLPGVNADYVLDVDGTNPVTLTVVGAGTAAVVYGAVLTVQRV